MKSREEFQVGFMALLRWILVEERQHSPESADRLLEAFPFVVAKGVLGGHFTLRETARELETAGTSEQITTITEACDEGGIWLAQE